MGEMVLKLANISGRHSIKGAYMDIKHYRQHGTSRDVGRFPDPQLQAVFLSGARSRPYNVVVDYAVGGAGKLNATQGVTCYIDNGRVQHY